MTFSRKHRLLLVLIALATIIYAAEHSSANDRVAPRATDDIATSGPPSSPSTQVAGPAFVIRNGILRAMDRGYLGPDDLEVLDFSSGDIEHGWNPKQRTRLESAQPPYFISGPKIDASLKHLLDTLTDSSVWKVWKKSNDPVVNLHRLNYGGQTRDTLYLILPNMTKEACITWFNWANNPNLIAELPVIEVRPDNHTIIEDSPASHPRTKSCARSSDGTLYLSVTIVSRTKEPGSGRWRMGP